MSAPSHLIELDDPRLTRRGIRLFVKRDDELFVPAYPGDRALGGNKWRKLKYNLEATREGGVETLLTFGGAFSNHLAATASAGRRFGFRTVGIIRGERVDNPTLRHARACGMELEFVDRAAYRRKAEPEQLRAWEERFGAFYLIPEGGTNLPALRGCAELAEELSGQLPPEPAPVYFCLAAGTGGTLAGLASGLNGRGAVLGFPVLRGDFLQRNVEALLNSTGAPAPSNWSLLPHYHFGGYAKFSGELIDFINAFRRRHGIPLDPIYTGKLFYGLFDLAEKGFFPAGSRVVAVHTGGLQGIAGFNERFEELVEG